MTTTTKRVSGTASSSSIKRISAKGSSRATKRVGIDPVLTLEGDEEGILLLDGDAQDDATDGLKIEGDSAVFLGTLMT